MTSSVDQTKDKSPTKSKRRTRYTLFPDGEYRWVDKDFDRSVFSDPESVPRCDALLAIAGIEESKSSCNREHRSGGLEAIAVAMLAIVPDSLVAIASDAKGGLLGATVTRFAKGLTAAVFRAAFRSLPDRCKQVVFAAHRSPTPEVRDAAMITGECHLVTVVDIITID